MRESTHNLTDTGKITVLTTFLGVLVFAGVFLLNLGEQKIQEAEAQDIATTTVTVLNTPPQWTANAQEEFESSTTSPTDAGDLVSWTAIGTDANNEPYYLLICKTSASPTPNSSAAPSCDTGSNQWAVSTSTVSGQLSRAATTTQAGWAESNAWFGWICDDNATTPRCNPSYTQGLNSTSSPFSVNHRPGFSVFADSSAADPGTVVTFYSTSSDADSDGTADTVRLFVCNLADFSTSTNDCGPGGTIASSSGFVAADAEASYTIVIPTQDQDYTAYGYIIDNHGFESGGVAQGSDSVLSVNNVAPTVTAGAISLNGGADMVLSQAAAQTTGYTLSFTSVDSNSCQTSGSTTEIIGYVASIYRSGITDVTCDGTSGAYNPNNCYPSGVATTTWNLICTLDVTSCTSAIDTSTIHNCTFPLWYVADPTDGTATSTQYPTEHWMSAIQAVDDDFATGTKSTSTTPNGNVDVTSFLSFDLVNYLTIPYGSIEPGNQTDPIVATTTLSATGNVGLDERLIGESMCPTYQTGQECNNSSSSTVDADEQVFATSTVSYASGVALSSTTLQELELNVQKSTSTVSQATANTFWGIRIPGTITLSGDYEGENTFYGITGESSAW